MLQALANTLPRLLLETSLLPLVASALQRGSVPMQLACLELALLNKLQAAAGLAAFLRTVLPAVLSVLVGNDRQADTRSAASSAAPQVNREPRPCRYRIVSLPHVHMSGSCVWASQTCRKPRYI